MGCLPGRGNNQEKVIVRAAGPLRLAVIEPVINDGDEQNHQPNRCDKGQSEHFPNSLHDFVGEVHDLSPLYSWSLSLLN